MRGAWRGLVVHAAGVLGVAVVVDGASAVVFGEEFFDFPIALFGADAEFEVFAGDGVPVLEAQLVRFQEDLEMFVGPYFVHHHDGKKIAYRGEE